MDMKTASAEQNTPKMPFKAQYQGVSSATMDFASRMPVGKNNRLRQIVDRGPTTLEGRRVLHDIEAELQQLNHEDAQQVLDILLAKKQ